MNKTTVARAKKGHPSQHSAAIVLSQQMKKRKNGAHANGRAGTLQRASKARRAPSSTDSRSFRKARRHSRSRLHKRALDHVIQRYADLYDLAPTGYVSLDRSGRIEEINLTAAQLFGIPRGRLIGMPFMVFVAREDTALFLHHLVRCRCSDAKVETELRLKDVKRKIIHAYLSSAAVAGSLHNGAVVYQTAIIDLTERRRAEEKIQRSEKRYRSLFDLVPVALYACDADGIIREYNRRAVELWGREPGGIGEEQRLCASHRLYYPDGRPMPPEECPMARALRGEKLTQKDLEIVLERPDGDRRHVIAAPRTLTNEQGKIVGALNSLYDVTDFKRAETAALRLAAVVQSSHDAIAAKTLKGIITDWNQSAERIFGYKPKEIIGKSILTLIPKDRQGEEEQILKKIGRGESLDHYETVRRRKDGQLIDVSLTLSPIKDPKGQIVGASKIARDITKQKQTERRLAEQARLLDLSNDAIIVRDIRGRVVYWNHGAEEMYGFSAKEALGKITHDLLRTEYLESFEGIRRNLERNNRWSGELVHTRKDGKRIVVLSRWSLDRDAQGRPMSILESNTDITARKRAEQQQLALYQFAQRQHVITNIGEIHDAAMDAILSAMRCDRASILLFDKEKMMRFVAWRGLSKRYRKGVEGHSPWKADAKNPKPVCINDVDVADIPKRLKSTIRREGIRAAAFIPLIGSQKLIGKFMTYYDAPHVFTDGELKLATTIATQLAQAIEHKRDEEALRQKEAELESIVTKTPFMLTRCTRDLRYRYVSHAYAEFVGHKPEELAGKPIVEVIGKEALKKILPYVEKVLQGCPIDYEMEIPFQGIGAFWLHCVYTPDRDSDGNVVGWFASLAEVGRHKEAEALLQKSKKLLEDRVRERTRELHLANKELRAEIVRRNGLEGEILEVSDREQQRLAQELHDGLCQHLTAVAFMARSVGMRLKNHRVIEVKDIEKIAELVNNAATDTRNLSQALHRVDVDAGGLVAALEDLVDREMWRTPCRLEVKPSFHLDDDTVASHLYRIAREAVINANKHAEAREIVVALKGWQKGLVLSVTDDGVGFQKMRIGSRGLGFHIMNYRAGLIGGQLKIESPDKGGTRVACYLPNGTVESHKGKKRNPQRLSAKLTKALSALI